MMFKPEKKFGGRIASQEKRKPLTEKERIEKELKEQEAGEKRLRDTYLDPENNMWKRN